ARKSSNQQRTFGNRIAFHQYADVVPCCHPSFLCKIGTQQFEILVPKRGANDRVSPIFAAWQLLTQGLDGQLAAEALLVIIECLSAVAVTSQKYLEVFCHVPVFELRLRRNKVSPRSTQRKWPGQKNSSKNSLWVLDHWTWICYACL